MIHNDRHTSSEHIVIRYENIKEKKSLLELKDHLNCYYQLVRDIYRHSHIHTHALTHQHTHTHTQASSHKHTRAHKHAHTHAYTGTSTYT